MKNQKTPNEAERKAALAALIGSALTADDVQWVVNDSGELGVEIAGRHFFLYKGESLEYEDAKHDDGTPMMVRMVGKREFGETQWPQKWITAGRREDRYTEKLTYHPGLSDGKPEYGDWRPLPAPNDQAHPKPQTAESLAPLTVSASPESFKGFKFEHILLSVTIAHNRSIGQFDDSCAHQLQKAMLEYQGILMVDAQAQYKHCSEEQHTEGCECGLCAQVRKNRKGQR